MRILLMLCSCLLAGGLQAQTVSRTVNRTLTITGEGQFHLDEQPGAGVAWLNVPAFKTGTITFEAKGKDVLQGSFVGLAFHGSNDTTYDVVYLRPFNFRATDAVRRSHSVQYISLPRYDWELLRNQYPGKYEQAIDPAPDPNGWVKVKLVITATNVTTFINGKQVLGVNLLDNKHAGTRVGLWAGNNSGGDWRNVKVE